MSFAALCMGDFLSTNNEVVAFCQAVQVKAVSNPVRERGCSGGHGFRRHLRSSTPGLQAKKIQLVGDAIVLRRSRAAQRVATVHPAKGFLVLLSESAEQEAAHFNTCSARKSGSTTRIESQITVNSASKAHPYSSGHA
jgi:hypothetical protein